MTTAKQPHIFLIDNFDSFTFNLAYEFQVAGCAVDVWRNNMSAQQAIELIRELPKPNLVVMSPGPGTPKEAGCCIEVIQRAQGEFPIFGVCLGHQAIVEAFGGEVSGANAILHGKTSVIKHDEMGIFKNLPNPMAIARYHSLAATRIPPDLEATAFSGDVVMAIKHRSLPIVGVQFHPESILTPQGSLMIANIIEWAGAQ